MNDFFVNAVMAQYAGNIGGLDALDGIDIDAAVVGYSFGNDDAIVLDIDNIPFLEYTFYSGDPDGKEARSVINDGVTAAFIDDKTASGLAAGNEPPLFGMKGRIFGFKQRADSFSPDDTADDAVFTA